MESGSLVPDEVLADMIGELFTAASPDSTFLLDGFPRNIHQAEILDDLAAKHKATVSSAICIDVPEAIVLERLGGRRVCPKCGATFHKTTMPPKKEGVCDACGEELEIRKDDRPETIKNRLAVYEEQTAPLVKWYEDRGKLRRVAGGNDAERVLEAFVATARA